MQRIFLKSFDMQISDRILSLSASQTLAMSQRSAELKAQGIDVINLSVGEPDFFTPDNIKVAACEAVNNNFSFYSPVPGYLSLREAICEKLQHENGLLYEPSQILVSNGAKQSICQLLMATINTGDEVILPAPYWVSYPEMIKLAEGKTTVIPTDIEHDFKISASQLRSAITPRTKALILCSPSNPTGSVYSADELEALAVVLREYPDILVIADEIYEHINYVGRHASLAQCPDMQQRMVIVNGVSKGYAMTGWRIGWIAGPVEIVKACSKLQGQFTSGAGSISQKAAEAAYRGSQQSVEVMRQAFEKRRDLVVDLARRIAGFKVNQPQGAFYLFPQCSAYFGKSDGKRVIRTASDLAMYLLEEGHVAMVGGEGFGAPDYIRLSYATSEDNLREAFRRIEIALNKLR